MTREEAIEELKILKEGYWDDDGYGHKTEQYDNTMLALDMAINALEQEQDMTIAYLMGKYEDKEPCEDAISRQAVLSLWGLRLSDKEIYMAIHDMPSITPSRRKGHWVRVSIDKYSEHAHYWYKCDKCGQQHLGNTNYCPNCGAEMESEE